MHGSLQIDVGGRVVTVKLMDESWIINQCAGGHPFVPRAGTVWGAADHCSRLPVPGDQFERFMKEARRAYGNCAVIAWHGPRVLGHLVFLPRSEARRWQASGWEHFRPEAEDDGTLVVVNLAFCSLSGHEFRRKGIGKAMVRMMLDWAVANGWRRVEVYDTGPGVFPIEWFDLCMPPAPFWQGRGFEVFARRGDGSWSEEELEGILNDDPRLSEAERREKQRLIQAIRQPSHAAALGNYRYDLRWEPTGFPSELAAT